MRSLDWGALFRNYAAATGLLLVVIAVGVALFSSVISPYSPTAMSLGATFAPPQAIHLFGTDEFGRDVLSRVFDGARASIAISVSGVTVGMLMGGSVALLTGYLGGTVDLVFTRIV